MINSLFAGEELGNSKLCVGLGFKVVLVSFIIQETVLLEEIFVIFFIKLKIYWMDYRTYFTIDAGKDISSGHKLVNSLGEQLDISLSVSEDIFQELLIAIISMEEVFEIFS